MLEFRIYNSKHGVVDVRILPSSLLKIYTYGIKGRLPHVDEEGKPCLIQQWSRHDLISKADSTVRKPVRYNAEVRFLKDGKVKVKHSRGLRVTIYDAFARTNHS